MFYFPFLSRLLVVAATAVSPEAISALDRSPLHAPPPISQAPAGASPSIPLACAEILIQLISTFGRSLVYVHLSHKAEGLPLTNGILFAGYLVIVIPYTSLWAYKWPVLKFTVNLVFKIIESYLC
jgi:hypothetical protein